MDRATRMILLFACATEPATDTAADTGPRLCNGSELLCDRSVQEVAFLRTHNSHASEERGYTAFNWNHHFAIPTQLAEGVRALNVDVYDFEGQLQACHGPCELAAQPFVDVLDEIEGHLAGDPGAVLLIDFQDEAAEGAIEAAIDAHAIGQRVHVQDPALPWPTLAELLDAGTGLVTLDGNVYGTGWSYEEPEDLDCVVQGEAFETGLYEVTHVLTNPLASPANAEAINHDPVLSDHIDRCVAEVGFVNQVSIDFYSIGDGLALIDRLNGIERYSRSIRAPKSGTNGGPATNADSL